MSAERPSPFVSECSAREHDFIQNFQDAPHGSAVLNDEVDEGSTNVILADYRGTPLQTAMLNEEDELERSSPVWNQYSFHRLNAQFLNDGVDETHTEAIAECSAQDRPFERRKPPRTKYTGTRSFQL